MTTIDHATKARDTMFDLASRIHSTALAAQPCDPNFIYALVKMERDVMAIEHRMELWLKAYEARAGLAEG